MPRLIPSLLGGRADTAKAEQPAQTAASRLRGMLKPRLGVTNQSSGSSSVLATSLPASYIARVEKSAATRQFLGELLDFHPAHACAPLPWGALAPHCPPIGCVTCHAVNTAAQARMGAGRRVCRQCGAWSNTPARLCACARGTRLRHTPRSRPSALHPLLLAAAGGVLGCSDSGQRAVAGRQAGV